MIISVSEMQRNVSDKSYMVSRGTYHDDFDLEISLENLMKVTFKLSKTSIFFYCIFL